MEWKKLLGGIAPTVATVLGGPLAGLAVDAIGSAMGMDKPTMDKVQQAFQSGQLTGEQVVAVRTAEQALAIKLKELDIDLAKLNAETEKAYIADVQDARRTMGKDAGVFWLGISILLTFAGIMSAVLWGSFLILTGGITVKDVAMVAAVSGLIGSVVGYAAANAQQVVGYFYGSSQGSKQKTDALANAVSNLQAPANIP